VSNMSAACRANLGANRDAMANAMSAWRGRGVIDAGRRLATHGRHGLQGSHQFSSFLGGGAPGQTHRCESRRRPGPSGVMAAKIFALHPPPTTRIPWPEKADLAGGFAKGRCPWFAGESSSRDPPA